MKKEKTFPVLEVAPCGAQQPEDEQVWCERATEAGSRDAVNTASGKSNNLFVIRIIFACI